ncbi:MAG: SIMPL domain-containing protein [Betaproteobacteria bacterium]
MHDHSKKHLPMTAALTLGAILTLTGVTLVIGETASRVLRPGTAGISVTGEATAKADPDQAEFTLGLETRGATAREVQAKSAAAMAKVVQALTAAGLDRKDIRTSTYNLTPVRRWDEKSGRDVLTGYQATSLVTAVTEETAEVGALVDAAVSAGANTVQDISFSVADPAEVRQQALARAIADARSRAQKMAEAAGVRLGKVIAMSDATTVEHPVTFTKEALDLGAASRTARTPVEPGQIRFTTRVQVTFAIR